jgi:hypothetical protein
MIIVHALPLGHEFVDLIRKGHSQDSFDVAVERE